MIPTFITRAESAALVELARDRMVLELGAHFGHSTMLFAGVASEVWSVDWHFGQSAGPPIDSLPVWSWNTAAERLEGRVVGILGQFAQILPRLRPESFDLIFHDAYRGDAEVTRDLGAALPLLTEAGTFCCHDWGRGGVTAAARPLLGEPDGVVESLAIWIRPRAR